MWVLEFEGRVYDRAVKMRETWIFSMSVFAFVHCSICVRVRVCV